MRRNCSPKLRAFAGHVLVKDHFEYGNDGGRVPERYFTCEGFVRLAKRQRLVITALNSGLDLTIAPLAWARCVGPDWQFIAVLRVH